MTDESPSDYARLADTLMRLPWKRTCQECGAKQEDKDPRTLSGESLTRFENRKCRVCKSPALDYGQENKKEETGD